MPLLRGRKACLNPTWPCRPPGHQRSNLPGDAQPASRCLDRSAATVPLEEVMTSTLKFALAAGIAAVALTGPASAQFQDRTIRVSNGINADHPIGNGLAKMNQCVGEKSGGKMKLQGFWGNALGG